MMNCALMKEGIAISKPPLHLLILKVFTSYYFGKEVLEKMILVPEKSLIFPKNFYMNHVPWKSKIIMYMYM